MHGSCMGQPDAHAWDACWVGRMHVHMSMCMSMCTRVRACVCIVRVCIGIGTARIWIQPSTARIRLLIASCVPLENIRWKVATQDEQKPEPCSAT